MFLALWEYEVKSGCEESVKKDSRAPMARVVTGLGSSEAIRTTARLVSWVIPFVLRFTSLSISGIGLLVVSYASRRFASLATWR